MSEAEKENVELSDIGKIIIKKEAFKNILTHILEFGNIYLDYATQAMGFCIGKINRDQEIIEVVNTIPISHGDNIEIGFSEKDRAALLNIQNLHPGQVIGWYHSHPGFNVFFSKADKANNLYFQNDKNPLGFGIVLDPSKIKKDKSFGFEIYRLKDFKLGVNSNSVRVQHEIELPNSLEYFTWIKNFIEESQMKSPVLIRERSEIREQSRFELQEIPTLGEEITEKEYGLDNKQVESVFTGLKEGTIMFSNSIIDTFRAELTAWEREFNQGTVQSTKKIQEALKQMGSVSNGLEKVENYIDKVFKKRINEFNNEVYSLVSQRVKKQKDMRNDINQIRDSLINDTNNRVNDAITHIYEELKTGLNMVINKVNEIRETNLTLDESITKLNNLISVISKQIEEETKKIKTSIKPIIDSYELNQLRDYDKIIGEIDPLQSNHSEIRELIDKFQKVISDLRNIKK